MAKVFELHFNPREQRKKDVIFDTFCFSSETRQETRLGSLYLVGEIRNILLKNQTLLADLAEVVKNSYYEILTEEVGSTEERLKQALQKANQFLANQPVDLNFAAVSVTPDLSINLSKMGNIKVLVFTQGEVFGIGEPSSATKTFPNIVEGKLTKGDKILVATKEVFETFKAKGILENLAAIKKPKELKKFLKEKKGILRELFGACLLIFVKKQRRKIYLKLPRIPVSRISQNKSTKGLLYALILAILLLLGYLLF